MSGLPFTKVALMQFKSGQRKAALNTLTANGCSPKKANAFLDRARLSGIGTDKYDPLKTPSKYQSTSDEDLDGEDDSDDDATVSEDGYTTVEPDFDEDEMLSALENPPDTETQADLPPQEAYETMKFEAPLDEEETYLLQTTPFLQEDPHGRGDPIRWIDDSDHDEWLQHRSNDGYKGMDRALEDSMYGNLTEEEQMDRAGTEVGFGLSSLKRGLRKAGRVAKRAGRVVTKPVSKLVSVVKKFVPGRDANKAKIVKSLNTKLVREHANYLAAQGKKRGINKPASAYTATSRLWAKNKIQAAGLPTSFTTGSTVAGNILGDSACGSWWDPLSWFQSKTNVVLVNTQGERIADQAAAPPDDGSATPPPDDGSATPPPDDGSAAPPPDDGSAAPPPDDGSAAPPPDDGSAPPDDGSQGEDFVSMFTSAFKKGQEAGQQHFSDDSEGEDDMIGKYYRSIKDPLADIEGGLAIASNGDIVRRGDFAHDITGHFVRGRFGRDFSEGAAEEALIEVTGDADIGRKFRPQIRVAREGRPRGMRSGKPKLPPPSPEAVALKASIKNQLLSKVVSQALVTKWAAARAGAPDGQLFQMFSKMMRKCIQRRGASISADKSETSGMGDFVGWA